MRGYLHWTLHRQLRVGGGMAPGSGIIAMEPGTLNRKPAPRLPLPRHRPRQRHHGRAVPEVSGLEAGGRSDSRIRMPLATRENSRVLAEPRVVLHKQFENVLQFDS